MRLNFTERRRRSVARAEKAKGMSEGFKRFCVPQNGDFDIRAWPSRRAICGMKFDDVQARLIDPVAMNWILDGLIGVEPIFTNPEFVVLPLDDSPLRKRYFIEFCFKKA